MFWEITRLLFFILFLPLVSKYHSSIFKLIGFVFLVIFMNNSDILQKKHTESIRYVMSGAAPIGANDAERFQQIAPDSKFFQGYGLTETSPLISMSAVGSKNYASVGHPSPDTECKIVDINDSDFNGLGPNESGELWVRGPQVMAGYHKNEKATKETITPDGWLRTGDIAHYDENGELYITDRLKELIKVNAFQVPPAELEEILRDHPAVAEAAVIGIPHPQSGEVPRAYVVKKKNSETTEKEIEKFVEEKVAKYKRLEGGVEFIDAIPKNATGKILRRELKIRFNSEQK
jgi:4-coumarate--CoA ligase